MIKSEDTKQRFGDGSQDYSRFRPGYPEILMQFLAREIERGVSLSDIPVVDVGAGTGIFTRQLVQTLPADIPVVGIEPSAGMRDEALSISPGLSIVDGSAEALPLSTHSARAITAATAAHWFDRPAFYEECRRVLIPGGVLAIVEYVRASNVSPAAKLVEDFLRDHGEQRRYERPDYGKELANLDGFQMGDPFSQVRYLDLTMEGYTGLALSSSHARKVIQTFGRDEAAALLSKRAGPIVNQDGKIPFGYRFDMWVAKRER